MIQELRSAGARAARRCLAACPGLIAADLATHLAAFTAACASGACIAVAPTSASTTGAGPARALTARAAAVTGIASGPSASPDARCGPALSAVRGNRDLLRLRIPAANCQNEKQRTELLHRARLNHSGGGNKAARTAGKPYINRWLVPRSKVDHWAYKTRAVERLQSVPLDLS